MTTDGKDTATDGKDTATPPKSPRKKSAIFYFTLGLLAFAAVALVTFLMRPPIRSERPIYIAEKVEAQADRAISKTGQIEESPVEIDVKSALSSRILGNEDAPIKISEHSSLTCGHCGRFHKETFARFKAAYIDTGKAYLVFSDFPLNAPALHASMVARCLPQERYFDFVQMLFEKQDEWAYDSKGYIGFLKNKARAYGLSEAAFNACLQNKDVQDGILGRMKASQTHWDIHATPSFVINNRAVIAGAFPFEEMDRRIQDAVKASHTAGSGLTPMPPSTPVPDTE